MSDLHLLLEQFQLRHNLLLQDLSCLLLQEGLLCRLDLDLEVADGLLFILGNGNIHQLHWFDLMALACADLGSRVGHMVVHAWRERWLVALATCWWSTEC